MPLFRLIGDQLIDPPDDLVEVLGVCPHCEADVYDGDGPDCAECGEPLPRGLYDVR